MTELAKKYAKVCKSVEAVYLVYAEDDAFDGIPDLSKQHLDQLSLNAAKEYRILAELWKGHALEGAADVIEHMVAKVAKASKEFHMEYNRIKRLYRK